MDSLFVETRNDRVSRVLSATPTRGRVRVIALDVWAFALPAVSFAEITLVGRLIVSEILALALLPWLLGQRDRLRAPRWFLVLWGAWLASQIVTDLVVGSTFVDFSRGWATILFTLTNFIAIMALVSTPRRARLFALGLAVGGVVGYFVNPNINAAVDPWKWAFAEPIALVVAVGVSGTIGFRIRWLPALAFGIVGAVNVVFGSRSLGGVALATSGYLLFNGIVGRAPQFVRPSIPRALFGLAISVVMVLGVLFAYDSAASGGFLGADAQTKYYSQSGSLGVLIGGRPEILASTQAIIDSPVLGHGSWAKDFKYVDLLSDSLSSLGYSLAGGPNDIGLIPAHSYLFGAWVQAGLLGGLFWLAIVALTVWLLLNLYAVRLPLGPLLVFCAFGILWSAAFSPYGDVGRIFAPYKIALFLLGLSAITAGSQPGDRNSDRPSG